jgi:hypothetical protein
LVEGEFRGRRASGIKTASVGAGMVIVVVAGFVVIKAQGFENQISERGSRFRRSTTVPGLMACRRMLD